MCRYFFLELSHSRETPVNVVGSFLAVLYITAAALWRKVLRLISFEFFRGSRKYVLWVPPSDTILFIDACNDPARRNIQPLRIKCNRNENSFYFDTAVTVRSHEMKLGLVFCLTVFSPHKASFCSDFVLCFTAQNLSTLLLNQLQLHCSN